MKSSVALLAFAASAALANPMPQAVTASIAPSSAAPAGCSTSYSGTFEITVVNVTSSSKRDLSRRQTSGILTLSLSGGNLVDQAGRTGYIASNGQFQFDKPPQAGAIYTSGFSVCANGSLALGGSAVWQQCYSGGFYNLYDTSLGGQCNAVYIEVIGGSGSATSAAGAATQSNDGQPAATTAVSIKSEGQPVVTSQQAVSQIHDGQPQAPTGAPVSQIHDGQPQAPTGAPVSVKSEGQPVVTSAAAAPVSVKSEGQPVVTSVAAVSVKSEGQPVVTSAAAAPVSVKSEGQPIVTSVAPVSVKSEGQPIVSSAAIAAVSGTSSALAIATGAAAQLERGNMVGLAGAFIAAVALL